MATTVFRPEIQLYPVGAIYLSVSSTSPAILFGGTWEQIQDTFLLTAGSTYTAGSTGGSATKSYTPAGTVENHTLSIDEIPSHAHNQQMDSATGTYGAAISDASPGEASDGYYPAQVGYVASSHKITTETTGGGNAHNHEFSGTAATIDVMPPYLTVYAWKRIA